MPARALLHPAPRSVEIMELPTPRPAAGEVLVRTVVPRAMLTIGAAAARPAQSLPTWEQSGQELVAIPGAGS